MKRIVSILVIILMTTNIAKTSDLNSHNCLQRWWNRKFGTDQIISNDRGTVTLQYMFNPEVINEASLELWRLDHKMVGVTDIITTDGKRHIQVATTTDRILGHSQEGYLLSAIEQQVTAFQQFRSTIAPSSVLKYLVTIFYAKNQYGIVDVVSNSHQKNFSQKTDGVVPIVHSYIPMNGQDFGDKNHFRYIVGKNKAECDFVTPFYNGTTLNILEEHIRQHRQRELPTIEIVFSSEDMQDVEMQEPLLI